MDLPDEILASIFQWLTCIQVATRAAQTCWRWRAVALDPTVRRLCIGEPIQQDPCVESPGREACRRAAAAGHIACARNLLVSHGRYGSLVVSTAARHGHANLLAWLINGAYDPERDADACSEAASGGHVDCLALLHKARYPLHTRVLWTAARYGHIDCVDYAIAHGCQPDQFYVCQSRSTPAHLACVKKIVAAGGRTNPIGDMVAVRAGHVDCLRLFGGSSRRDGWACQSAAYRGNLEMLHFLHKNGWDWDARTFKAAAESDNHDCLAYVVKKRCPWTFDDLCRVARSGRWANVMAVIRPESGDTRPTTAAASMGRLDLLSDLCQQGYACESDACLAAAFNGHVDCLHYLYKQRCAWDARTLDAALAGANRRCFEYAVARGCPLTPRTRKAALARGWKTEPRLPLSRPP
ncbi:ankyrin repeat protein [Pandoravirus inopinatum]|uniref:Ankyrin repeat protein n=1 Tax=Pandoravirus inopinatum TaxID=1605721 RepID=A0A0B5J5Z6_9VIRU|nr:ankyrin repeat protein [Pandoravirus inopinatum]AJF97135.1 ankyrin repeat protein [Pandoravirus inopinatum]